MGENSGSGSARVRVRQAVQYIEITVIPACLDTTYDAKKYRCLLRVARPFGVEVRNSPRTGGSGGGGGVSLR